MELLSIFQLFCIASLSLGTVLEVEARKIFTVTDYCAVGDGITDDSLAFQKAWEDVCGEKEYMPTLIVPMGKTFLLKPITFRGPCNSNLVNVQILGNIVAPDSISAWGDKCGDGSWIRFDDVDGLFIWGTGTIDGKGWLWWRDKDEIEILGSLNKNKRDDESDCEHPTALHIQNSRGFKLSGLVHLNSPRNHLSLSECHNAVVSNITMIAPGESPNTDGIDISSSSNVLIQDSFIGTGDDCVAINGGSSFINITNVICGPGHGISVGSLGADGEEETVEEVNVWNCTLNGTHNGVRIKTWQGGSGFARNIDFKNITLKNVKNPIIIDQYYCIGEHDCKNETSAVKIRNVTYSGIEGSCASDVAISLKCSESTACENIVIDNINITSSEPGKEVSAFCYNAKGTFLVDTPNVTCSP